MSPLICISGHKHVRMISLYPLVFIFFVYIWVNSHMPKAESVTRNNFFNIDTNTVDLFNNKHAKCSFLSEPSADTNFRFAYLDLKLPTVADQNSRFTAVNYDKDLGQLKLLLDTKLAMTLFQIENSGHHVSLKGMYYSTVSKRHGGVYGSCTW